MTIDEAIKEQDDHFDNTVIINSGRYKAATALGIEALKRVKWHKAQHQVGYYELLPGETEEPNSLGLPLGGIVIKTEEGDQK